MTRGGETGETDTDGTGGATGDSATSTTGPGTTGLDSGSSGPGTDGSTTSPVSTSGTTGGGNCTAPWRTSVASATLYGATLSDGRLYVVGQNEMGAGHVAVLDPCDGTVQDAVQFGHGMNPETVWTSAAATVDGLFVAGRTSPGVGLWQGVMGRLDATTLAADWTVPIDGSTQKKDHFNTILGVSTGRLWAAGKLGEALEQRAWFGSASPLGQACGFTWGGQAGESFVLLEGEEVIYAIVNRPADAVLLHFDPTCTCNCAPTFTSAAIAIGAVATEVFGAIRIGDNLYVVGRAFDDAMSGNARAFVAALDAATGTVTGQATYDDGTLIDAMMSLATDGNALFIGGTTKWAGVGYYGGASGHIWAYDLPLINGAQPLWDTDLANVEAVLDVERDPATGHLYLTATDASQGVVIGCDDTWTCE
ncbi:MAG: hypothetical protein D6705_04660 [Deltaproteobacteria bacterium]|nr:MAG: hypothetical protein D6705_04660 [Deltaproteobacteria bacterium]